MPLSRSTINIHSGLEAEITLDDATGIGEAFISGRSYGFVWSTEHGLQWDKTPPYPTVEEQVKAIIGE